MNEPAFNLPDQPSEDQSQPKFKIWIDGDACPVPIREIVYRTSKRLKLPVVIVANASLWLPKSELLTLVVVPSGANVADQHIVKHLKPRDIVITADIPLASEVVAVKAIAIGVRGELFDEQSVHGRLGMRNLMEQFRAAGMETGGPKPFGDRDVREFANQLDRVVTKRLRQP